MEGDYFGADGLTAFFKAMAAKTGASVDVQPVSATPVGNELLVVHIRGTMCLDGTSVMTDAAIVWRIVDGHIAEAWGIPAVFTPPAL